MHYDFRDFFSMLIVFDIFWDFKTLILKFLDKLISRILSLHFYEFFPFLD